jgi:FkbM family methyltransferase
MQHDDWASLKRRARRLTYVAGVARLLGFRQTLSFALARARRSKVPLALHVRGLSHPVYLRADGTDLNCFWQIFGQRDCAIDLPRPPRAIVDGGAHIGFASIYFANRFPQATIIAVEPEAANYALARQNLAPYPNVHLVRGGIWCRDAWLAIKNPHADSWAFRVLEVADHAEGSFQGHSIDSLLRSFGLDGAELVKLDIEGAEIEVFGRGTLRWLDRTEAVVIELHGREAERVVGQAMDALGLAHRRRGEKVIFVRELEETPVGVPRLAEH